ncbi:MAG: CYTH domain-containing protein, partial [Proteobacteria bacterium]
ADAERRESMVQGYLAATGRCAVRVRLEGERARLNIKSAGLDIERMEYEYEIPVEDAAEIIDCLCGSEVVRKTRHYVTIGSHTYEVDEFEGENAGLVVAEVELKTRDEAFPKPAWLGEEVSGDPRYLNSNLASRPFSRW